MRQTTVKDCPHPNLLPSGEGTVSAALFRWERPPRNSKEGSHEKRLAQSGRSFFFFSRREKAGAALSLFCNHFES
jgi:hypothetical protein